MLSTKFGFDSTAATPSKTKTHHPSSRQQLARGFTAPSLRSLNRRGSPLASQQGAVTFDFCHWRMELCRVIVISGRLHRCTRYDLLIHHTILAKSTSTDPMICIDKHIPVYKLYILVEGCCVVRLSTPSPTQKGKNRAMMTTWRWRSIIYSKQHHQRKRNQRNRKKSCLS